MKKHNEQASVSVDDSPEWEKCIYCGMPLTNENKEEDHVPIPRSCGGTEKHPACKNCHTLKDRIPMKNWPIEYLQEFWNVFEKLTPIQRIVFSKVTRILLESNNTKEGG